MLASKLGDIFYYYTYNTSNSNWQLNSISRYVSDTLFSRLCHWNSTTSIRVKNLRNFNQFTCTFIKIFLLLAFWNTLSSEILSWLCSKWIQRNIMRMKELTSLRRSKLADKNIKINSRKNSNEPNLLSPYLSKALSYPQPPVQSFVVIHEGHVYCRESSADTGYCQYHEGTHWNSSCQMCFPSTSNSFSVALWSQTDAHKEVWCHLCFQYRSKQTQPRWVP